MSINFSKILAGATTILLAATLVSGCGGGSTNLPRPANNSSSIVFISDRDNALEGDYDLYRINPDGSNLQRLTNNSPINDTAPALSPDGRKIAFASAGRPENGTSGANIYVINVDGSQVQQLTTGGEFNSGPVWSPDGRRILFSSNRDGLGNVYVMNADGSNQTNLTGTQGGGSGIFNGDGSKIVFLSRRDINDPTGRTPASLYIMNSDGSDQKRFSLQGEGGPTNNYASQFSPDGRRILFYGGPGFGGGGPSGIFVSNADGTDYKQLLTSGSEPVWSPDGQRIAFSRNTDGNPEIFTAQADGTDVRQLTNNSALDYSPTWR